MRLFGDDIFISYAHFDAGEYALALLARLSKRHAVYVDRVGSKAGEQISNKVLRHLKNASMLIVIVSEDATRADSKVREEMELFAKTDRPVLVIDAGGALKRCAWLQNLKGLSIARESPEAFAKHRPSPGVRRSVEQTRKYWTRTNRLLAIAASIIIVTIVVVAVATLEVQRQQKAASALRLANLATTAWQQQRTPVDDVLLLVAESLRRGATPSALQLASVARALRARPGKSFRHHLPKETMAPSLNGETLFVVDKNRLLSCNLSTTNNASVTLPCSTSAIDTFLPAAVAMYCTDGLTNPYQVNLADRSIRPRPPGQSMGEVTAAGRLADGFVVGRNDTVELRDRKSGRPLIQLPLAPRSAQQLHFSGDGRVLAVVTLSEAGASVLLFDVPSGKPRGQLAIASYEDVIAINHDGSALAVMSGPPRGGFASGMVLLARRHKDGHWLPEWHLPFRNSHATLAFAGDAVLFLDDNAIRIIGMGEEGEARELRRITADQPPNDAAVLANGEVALITDDRVARWNVAPIPAPGGYLMAIDSTASRIALWRGGTAIVRDLGTGIDVFRHTFSNDDQDLGFPMVLDPGGRRVVIGVRGGTETYDVVSGELLTKSHEPLPYDTPAAARSCVSADRQRTAKVEVVTGDVGYRVLLYNAATKRLSLEIPVPDDSVIAFRPGTRELLVVSTAGNVATVDDDPLQVANAICRDVGHSLSRERWSHLTSGEPWVDTCAEVAKSRRSRSRGACVL
jgi:hypothetical protein